MQCQKALFFSIFIISLLHFGHGQFIEDELVLTQEEKNALDLVTYNNLHTICYFKKKIFCNNYYNYYSSLKKELSKIQR